MDIANIPANELILDLDAAYGDIINCKAALKLNIVRLRNNESVQGRLEANEWMVKIIKAELARRRGRSPRR